MWSFKPENSRLTNRIVKACTVRLCQCVLAHVLLSMHQSKIDLELQWSQEFSSGMRTCCRKEPGDWQFVGQVIDIMLVATTNE